MSKGDVYTVAGDASGGDGGSGVPATGTSLHNPVNAAVDVHGNLVIADSGNPLHHGRNGLGSRVRVVAAKTGHFYSRSMKAGEIYTIAGTDKGFGFSGDGGPATAAALGVSMGQVAIDGAAFSGDGGPAIAAELDSPAGVTADSAGNLLIADAGNGRVRVVAAASGTFYGQAITAGDIDTVAGDGRYGFSGDGGPASSAEFANADSVAVNAAGDLLVTDLGNNRVRMVSG